MGDPESPAGERSAGRRRRPDRVTCAWCEAESSSGAGEGWRLGAPRRAVTAPGDNAGPRPPDGLQCNSSSVSSS